MDHIKELLEAYDTGARPFNQESNAYDLLKELDPLIVGLVEEEVSAKTEEGLAEQKRDAEAAHMEAFDNFQENIEEVFPEGAASDIVALLTKHLPREA